MNYQWHYDRLIKTRINRECLPNIYYEKHHIIPKSMGGSDDSNNLVKLTLREHFLAHLLLWKIYRNSQMAAAFVFMTGNMRKQNFVTSSRMYEEVRLAASFNAKTILTGVPKSLIARENMKAVHQNRSLEERKKINDKISNSNKGVERPRSMPMSEEHKDKIGESNIGKNTGKIPWMKDKSHNEESIQKMKDKAKERIGEKNGFFEKTHTQESRDKMSVARKNRITKDETIEKLKIAGSGRMWINNGISSTRIKIENFDKMVGGGWVRGRLNFNSHS